MTQKNIDYFKELISMAEQGDEDQVQRLTYLLRAVKRYNASLLKKDDGLYQPGQLGAFSADDDIMLIGLTRAGEKPPSYGRK